MIVILNLSMTRASSIILIILKFHPKHLELIWECLAVFFYLGGCALKWWIVYNLIYVTAMSNASCWRHFTHRFEHSGQRTMWLRAVCSDSIQPNHRFRNMWPVLSVMSSLSIFLFRIFIFFYIFTLFWSSWCQVA